MIYVLNQLIIDQLIITSSFLNSPAKSVYSVDIGKEISRIVVDKQIADINTGVAKIHRH